MNTKIRLLTFVVLATFLGITGLTNLSNSGVFSQTDNNNTIIVGSNTNASEKLPLYLSGTIHHFTNNNTQPPGVWVIVGTWSLNIQNMENAEFVSDVVQARVGSIPYEQRNETSNHITDFRTESISITDKEIKINGTANNVQNGSIRFEDIPISLVIKGGDAIPYSQIYLTQGGEATNFANGATPWYGAVNQQVQK